MADAKKTKREQFETAVFELGLTLIEDYRNGTCRDRDKTLGAIVELFKVSQNAKPFLLEGNKSC